ncbi:MAG: YheU family protein [Myxococcota bacterium]
MKVPYTALSEAALRGVITEFVTREGTDYGDRIYSLDEKIKHVMGQLRAGKVHIFYDEDTETCNLLTQQQLVDAEREAAQKVDEEG